MSYLRLLGAALGAVLVLGAVAAATASAAETEAGLLYLEKESGQVRFEGQNGDNAKLEGPGGEIKCTEAGTKGASTQTEKHITTGTTSITFIGCKLTKGTTKVACNSEGDAKETLLLPTNFTLFNALGGTGQLEPGFGITLTKTLKINCGAVAIVELKGTALGLITEVFLTADQSVATLDFFSAGETCDSENIFCKKAQEQKNELLLNFTGAFERGLAATDLDITFSKMVLIDD